MHEVVCKVRTDDGIDLWSQAQGQGPGIVVCHGGPGLWDYLKPLADLLSNNVRVYRYDQRGCGRSEGTEGPFTLDRFIRDLDAVRAASGYDSWVVGGHSWGAFLALYYALIYPSRVRGVLYVSGTGLEWDKWKHEHSIAAQHRRLGPHAARHEELRTKQKGRTIQEEREFNILHWSTDYADLEDGLVQAVRMADEGFAVNLECSARLNAEVRSLDAEDLKRQCAGLRVPVLVIHGALDSRPVRAVESLVTALPNAAQVVLPGTAHFPWHEKSSEFREVVTSWCTRLETTP